jgi:hypothetical protein
MRGLLTFAGVVMPMTAVAFSLALVLGRWVANAYLPIGCFVIRTVFLNLLLENVGMDAAVRLGDPALWKQAIEERLKASEGSGL